MVFHLTSTPMQTSSTTTKTTSSRVLRIQIYFLHWKMHFYRRFASFTLSHWPSDVLLVSFWSTYVSYCAVFCDASCLFSCICLSWPCPSPNGPLVYLLAFPFCRLSLGFFHSVGHFYRVLFAAQRYILMHTK